MTALVFWYWLFLALDMNWKISPSWVPRLLAGTLKPHHWLS
jgi:hypothetical protein